MQDLAHGGEVTVSGAYFIDATELGDLLPLTKTEYVTGFEAPDWYAYGWERHDADSNRSSAVDAPTRENTAGKVVVIHAFQSW